MLKTVNSRNHGLVLLNPLIGSLSGGSASGQSVPGNVSNKGVLRILQSSRIAGTSPSGCIVSYPGQSLGSLTSLSMYSTSPADWARPLTRVTQKLLFQ